MNELLAVMAVAYITYLVVESSLPPIAWVREKILDHAGLTIQYLLTCWWCTGFWASLIVVLGLWALDAPVHTPVLLVLAGALVAGLIGEVVGVMHMLHANLVRGLTRD